MNKISIRKGIEIVDKSLKAAKISAMSFWITSMPKNPARRILVAAMALALGLALSACGSKTSMAGGGQTDDQSATVHTSAQDETPTPTSLQGSEETSTPEAAAATSSSSSEDSEAHAKAARIPSGTTRSGPGKLARVTVRAGDTLWKIAERPDVYNSGWLYPLIYKANKAIIKDANNLPAGMVLVVPRDVPDPEVEKAKEEAMTGQFLEKTPVVGGVAEPGTATGEVQASIPVATPMPARSGSSGGTGRLGWILLLLLLAAVAVVAWIRLRKDSDSI
jgi:cobalamin biosynthesis Mg chelatase CobN